MEDIPKASVLYRKRYKIEVCFKHLKSSGFNLEDLQLEGGHKVNLMFGALTIIYLMAIQKGIVYFDDQPPQMKIFKHKTAPHLDYLTPAKSVFKKGCEILFENVFFFSEFIIDLARVSRWIAKKVKPLKTGFYTLKKISVQ